MGGFTSGIPGIHVSHLCNSVERFGSRGKEEERRNIEGLKGSGM
jgi:hypothetical protein